MMSWKQFLPRWIIGSFIWFIVAALLILAFGCDPIASGTSEKYETEDGHIMEIGGCEYVRIIEYQGVGLTHRGNCKFCAERRRLK